MKEETEEEFQERISKMTPLERQQEADKIAEYLAPIVLQGIREILISFFAFCFALYLAILIWQYVIR